MDHASNTQLFTIREVAELLTDTTKFTLVYGSVCHVSFSGPRSGVISTTEKLARRTWSNPASAIRFLRRNFKLAELRVVFN